MTRRLSPFLTLALVAGLALPLTGCSKLAQKLAQRAAGASASGTSASGDDPLDYSDHDEQLDGLIDCLNGLDSDLSRALDRYDESLKGDVKAGPTEKDTPYIPEIQSHSFDTCKKNLKDAEEKPNKELAAIATKYEEIVIKLVPVVNETYKYYDLKDYKDDKMAKGKELHGRLWPLAEQFIEVSKEFRETISKMNDARQEATIKAVEAKYGRTLHFQQLNVMRAAKAALQVAKDMKASVEDLQTVLTAYETAVTELDTYSAANKEAIDKEVFMGWSSFQSQATDFLKALKDRLRRARDKKPFSDFEQRNPEMAEGHPAKVSKEFNDLVSDSNRVKWR